MITNKEHKTKVQLISSRQVFIGFLLLSTFYFLLSTSLYGEVLDRIVAVVDDEVILLSELNNKYQVSLDSGLEVTREEVLDGMINRALFLKEARRFSTENGFALQTKEDENRLINEYIESRLKVFIRIHFSDIEFFYYEEKKSSFKDESFNDVKDEIEEYLIEKELNKRLIEHIMELKEKVYIKTQLTTGVK